MNDDSFPAPVRPEGSVHAARDQRVQELTRVMLLGICLRLVVISAELIGVAWSASATLFVDALASLFDVMSSLILLGAMRFAARPPDEDHPFGHGRAEPLAGFQVGILLCGTGLWMALRNLLFLREPAIERHLPWWVWTIPAGATVLLGLTGRLIQRTGKATHSLALHAESIHFQIDALTSLLATVTLLAAVLWSAQAPVVDHLGGALLALSMVLLGAHAAWENVHQLLDRVPSEEDFERVRLSARSVEGVIDVEKVRIQHAGPDAHVDIDIEVDPNISVADSHVITQHVRARIQTDWPFVREVVVHVEPFYEGDH